MKQFLRHFLRNRSGMLSLLAAFFRLAITLMRVPTIEAEFCALYCFEVQFIALGFQLIQLTRDRRKWKANRAEFKTEREIVDFWTEEMFKNIDECQRLDMESASWSEKKEARERLLSTQLRYDRETGAILKKWKRDIKEMEAK